MGRSAWRAEATLWGAAAALSGFAAAGCSEDPAPRGELVLALQSDLSIPKDIDAYDLEVSVHGKVVIDERRALGPDGDRIPKTIAVASRERRPDPVTIRLAALKQGVPRLFREVVTTVPHDRVAMLRLPFEYLCLDRVETSAGGTVTSDCGADQSCVGGVCRDREIDAEQLPDFEAPRVYGGGSPDGGGECFDALGCFEGARSVPIDESSCAFESASDSVNVALVASRGSAGICTGSYCLVPFDRDVETGWSRDEAGRVRLPAAACEKLTTGAALAVAVSSTCAAKTPETPLCGGWSSVKPRDEPEPDAGLELFLDASAGDAGLDGAGDAGPSGPPPRALQSPRERRVGGVTAGSLSALGSIGAVPIGDAGTGSETPDPVPQDGGSR